MMWFSRAASSSVLFQPALKREKNATRINFFLISFQLFYFFSFLLISSHFFSFLLIFFSSSHLFLFILIFFISSLPFSFLFISSHSFIQISAEGFAH
jgi:hypothetical protein